jgi:AraC-like DNA-binding protein
MTVEPIPVIRAAYLNAFMDALGQSASKAAAFLQQFNLPKNLADKPDAYVPLKNALSFAQWAARGTESEVIGLKLGSCLEVSHFSAELRSALQCVPSLGQALERFTRLADREQSNVRYRIERIGDEVRIGSTVNTVSLSDADYLDEWLRNMLLMTLIRYFTGDEWTPPVITFQPSREPGQHSRRAFPETRILTGQPETSIRIPVSLLSLATTRNRPRHDKTGKAGTDAVVAGPASWDFPASLQAILQAFLEDEYPDIIFAARIVGCSVRTLQRRLKEFRLSYTDVVQLARFHLATHLLRDPDTKVIDAAFAAGYEDPSHFARAFKRLAGISPNQYRQLNYAH